MTMKKFLILMTGLLLASGAMAQNPAHISRYAAANAALTAPTGSRVVLFGFHHRRLARPEAGVLCLHGLYRPGNRR